MSNSLFGDIDIATVIGDETIRQRFVVSSEQITGQEAGVEPPDDADSVVNTTQDEGFNSIQGAINEANDGDTIQLNDEEFEEDLTIDVSNITIEAPTEVTVIGVVTIEVSGVRIEGCEFAPDDNVERIVFVADDAEGVELSDCSFSGAADVALIFEGDDGGVIDCDFEEVDVDDEEHVLIVRGNDVLIRACVFLVVTEVEAVVVEADNVDIEDCEFEAVDVTVTRFIVVIEDNENVSIVGCTFEGEVQFEVIVLDGTDSTVLDCNFEDITKIDTETSIILVTGDDSLVEGCVFLVENTLEFVVFVDGADGVDIDDCDFETVEGIAVDQFIFVNDASTNVIIVRCVFIGIVNVATIKHDGTGDSEIRNCDFDAVELADGATLIIRVDDVTVEVDDQIVEVQIGNEFELFSSLADAIEAAEEDTKVIVGPGTYLNNGSVNVDTPGLDIRGPLAGTPGDDDARAPDDPKREAIIDGEVFLVNDDLTIDGLTLREKTMIEFGDDGGTFELQNLVVDGTGLDPGIQAFIFDEFDVSIQDNLIAEPERGIELSPTLEDSELTDTVDVTNNTIKNANVGIEVDDEDVANEDLQTIRDENTFVDTTTEILPEPFDAIVDGEGDEDDSFETVFGALENAGTGADIAVRPGVYSEDEFIAIDDRSISIQSTDGPEETTLETKFSVGIQADDVTIEGLEIVSGESAEVGLSVSDDTENATIRNNDIDTTESDFDIVGIGTRGTSATITDNAVQTQDRAEVTLPGPESDFSDFPERINDEELDDFDTEQQAFDAYEQTLLDQNDIDDVSEG